MIPPPEPEWMLWAMRFKLEHQAMVDRIDALEAECAILKNERTKDDTHATETGAAHNIRRFYEFHDHRLRFMPARTDTQASSTASTAENSRMPSIERRSSLLQMHQYQSQRVLRSQASGPEPEAPDMDEGEKESDPKGQAYSRLVLPCISRQSASLPRNDGRPLANQTQNAATLQHNQRRGKQNAMATSKVY